MPTLVLNARNDPFLPERDAARSAARKAAPCVVLEFPRTGGHVGFVTGRFPAATTGCRGASSRSSISDP